MALPAENVLGMSPVPERSDWYWGHSSLYTAFMDGLEFGSPSEGATGANEELSEQAKQRFAGAQQALQQIRKDEKKARKRDDGVAQLILQFLTDAQRTHLATLISRLVAINCPSHFILALLSLINEQCKTVVEEYLKEQPEGELPSSDSLISLQQLDETSSKELMDWMQRIDSILRYDGPAILSSIVIEEQNIDGTVLQLTTFVLEDFIHEQHKEASFDKLQSIAIAILQSIIAPHLQIHLERRLPEAESTKD